RSQRCRHQRHRAGRDGDHAEPDQDVYAERACIMGSERRELVGLLARELAFFDELGNVQRDLHRAPPTPDPRWRDDITNSSVASASGTKQSLLEKVCSKFAI